MSSHVIFIVEARMWRFCWKQGKVEQASSACVDDMVMATVKKAISKSRSSSPTCLEKLFGGEKGREEQSIIPSLHFDSIICLQGSECEEGGNTSMDWGLVSLLIFLQ
ncbi:hypothetical protein FRX31_017012 [Thalictrum thalictroides]|uniref:Uncharacterized protein n=1 Tax=Thalictrum thalictroides TaxID=46969 RepID=A0A7J6W9Y9_THATH|nr:hypothetical protein FRX31_017012 [Thalictrum thalictroides]